MACLDHKARQAREQEVGERADGCCWSGGEAAGAGGDEDDRMRFESEYESSELSEMDDDSDYTPDSDDEGRNEVEDDFETYEFQVGASRVWRHSGRS